MHSNLYRGHACLRHSLSLSLHSLGIAGGNPLSLALYLAQIIPAPAVNELSFPLNGGRPAACPIWGRPTKSGLVLFLPNRCSSHDGRCWPTAGEGSVLYVQYFGAEDDQDYRTVFLLAGLQLMPRDPTASAWSEESMRKPLSVGPCDALCDKVWQRQFL